GPDGRAIAVVKFATDITAEKMRSADTLSQIEAIDRSQGVIEFALDGTILKANANFLSLVGYTLAEVQGQHHRMFVDPQDRDSATYRAFWETLGRGSFQTGEFRRVGR
ncbi:histidine kinase, partial [Halomonas sp. ND22Bw]